MKNNALIYLLLAGGAIFLLSMKKKPKGYSIMVPEPEKITAEQFRQPSLLQKVTKAVKKVAPVVKKAVKAAKQKQSMKIGQFPDMC
jgi:hypothetical protein